MTAQPDRPKVEDLKHIEEWHGRYRDIGFYAAKGAPRTDPDGKPYDPWFGYLIVWERQVPADKWHLFWLPALTDDKYGRIHFDKVGVSWRGIGLNGDIHYYAKPETAFGRYVEIGGDFQHSWDFGWGRYVDAGRVLLECTRAIDELWEACPWLLTDKDIAEAKEAQP
jgi:hypothetical protein